jgi:hypothetical protein
MLNSKHEKMSNLGNIKDSIDVLQKNDRLFITKP